MAGLKQASRGHVKRLERLLYSYPALMAGVENSKHEYEITGLTANYSGMPGGDGISTPTENVAIRRVDKEIKVKQIERALAALTYIERDLITFKYFNPGQPSDVRVMEEIGFKNTAYYKLKDQAIRKMATALNFI